MALEPSQGFTDNIIHGRDTVAFNQPQFLVFIWRSVVSDHHTGPRILERSRNDFPAKMEMRATVRGGPLGSGFSAPLGLQSLEYGALREARHDQEHVNRSCSDRSRWIWRPPDPLLPFPSISVILLSRFRGSIVL